MKIIEDLIFTQYYELQKKERPVKSAKTTALILISVLGVLTITAVFMILYASGLASGVANVMSGRGTGKLLALLSFAVVFGIAYFLYGREQKYKAIIAERESLSIDEKEKMYKTGMQKLAAIFIGLMAVIILCGFIAQFK